MYKVVTLLAGALFTFVVFAVPDSVLATTTTSLADFAGCSGTDCSACNLVSLANGVIVWLIGFLCFLFAVIIAVAGFGLVTSNGNRSVLDQIQLQL